jgi:hypothetical protein
VALAALATACVVGGLEVNPALDPPAAAGKAGVNGHGGGSVGGKGAAGESPGDGAGGAGAGHEGGSPDTTVGGTAGVSGSGSAALGGDGSGGEAGANGTPGCEGYSESDDLGNAFAAPDQAGAAEVTSQPSSASGTVSVCGQVDVGHFSAQTNVVDVDSYSFVLPQAAEIFLSVEFAGTVAAEDVELVVSGTGVANQRVRAAVQDASMWVKLGAGTATVSVVVHSVFSLTKPIHYLLRAAKDDLSKRCAHVSEAEAYRSYNEAQDGAANTHNDVVIPSLALEVQQPTDDTTDRAEDGSLSPVTGERALITGAVANVDHGSGASYLDGDMYVVSPIGADQLTVRLDWAGTTSDLDLWVFAADDFRAVAHATSTSKMGPEAMTFAIDRSTDYWVWVGAVKGSTGLPQAYDVTICSEGLGI